MAFVPLVPGSINVTHRKGTAQQYRSSAVVDFAGAAIDLSAYDGLAAKLVPLSPGPNTSEIAIGTVTGTAAGLCLLTLADTDLANANPGSAQIVITGAPVNGDDAQLLASGTFQLQEG